MRIAGRADAERREVAERVRRLLDLAGAGQTQLPEMDPSEITAEIPIVVAEAPRLVPSLRSVLAFGTVAIAVAALSLWWVLRSRPEHAEIHAQSVASPAALVSPASASASSSAALVVDVVGQVKHPGVYHLPAGARITDAIDAAGGVLPGMDLSTLNLAQRVSDGQQIAVGVAGATAAAQAGPTGGASSGGPLNLNSATAEQLDALPGVGPVLAQNIVAWRTAHGRFDNVEQLRQVSGIGPAKFATLKGAVMV